MTVLRFKNGWSKAELARRVGMNASSIGRIENDKEPIGSRGAKISAALGWTGDPCELLDDVRIYDEAVRSAR